MSSAAPPIQSSMRLDQKLKFFEKALDAALTLKFFDLLTTRYKIPEEIQLSIIDTVDHSIELFAHQGLTRCLELQGCDVKQEFRQFKQTAEPKLYAFLETTVLQTSTFSALVGKLNHFFDKTIW